MEGENRITLMGRPEDGGKPLPSTPRHRPRLTYVPAEYVITMPNMYARGILFGKMVIELGDACTARNDAHDLNADIEFKTKGFFSGTYNAIAGRVKHGTTDLGDVSGKWSALMEFKPTKVILLLPPPSSFSLWCVKLDRGEAHAVRRTETRQRHRAQMGRSGRHARTIRES